LFCPLITEREILKERKNMLSYNYPLYAQRINKNFIKNSRIIQALKEINIEIREGEIFGLLGPNGSGKSTLIRVASTLIIPDSGIMTIFGLDVVKDAKSVRRLISRVSVEASFFKKLSPIENLLFTAGIYGLSKSSALRKIFETCEKIGLDRNRLNDPIEEFSRGMQQKVAIARAFLTEPKLLLLDEPTTGLDPRAKKKIQLLILETRKNLNVTILLTTHDMEEAEKLSDYIAIIHEGKIVVSGKPGELKKTVEKRVSNPTFEDVFMEYTGVKFEQVEQEQEEKDNVW